MRTTYAATLTRGYADFMYIKVTLDAMAASRSTSNATGIVPIKLIPVKGSAHLHRRLKIAAAEDGMTYAELISHWLDERDARNRQLRQTQAHPFHRPPEIAQMEA